MSDVTKINELIEEMDHVRERTGMLLGQALCVHVVVLVQMIEACPNEDRHNVMLDIARAIITGDVSQIVATYSGVEQ